MLRSTIPLSRRHLLRSLTASAIASSLPRCVLARETSAAWTPLGVTAGSRDIFFGFAVNDRTLVSNDLYDHVVARECTIMTPENAMKWEAVHPARDQYTFARADGIVSFAESHSICLRGHNFCWHRAIPEWVMREVTSANAEAVLREHIAVVAGRYKGKMHSWDVANESIQLKDDEPGGWRKSFWYEKLGARYVDIAFEAAQQADPSAILTYNDFGLEYENHSDTPKRRAVLEMLQDLKKRGVPVGALGLQSHLRAGTGEQFGKDLASFIAEVGGLGLKIFITEMDVDDSRLTLEGSARDRAIADVYKRYLDLVLGAGDVSVVITWGVWDVPRVTGAEAMSGPVAQHPLLFAPDGTAKLDAFAVAESLRNAPMRHGGRGAKRAPHGCC